MLIHPCVGKCQITHGLARQNCTLCTAQVCHCKVTSSCPVLPVLIALLGHECPYCDVIELSMQPTCPLPHLVAIWVRANVVEQHEC